MEKGFYIIPNFILTNDFKCKYYNDRVLSNKYLQCIKLFVWEK